MKFLLFGTGDYYERYKKWFSREDTLALLDNSPDKQKTIIDGIRVLAPEEGIQLPFDAIVVLSFYIREMKRQLMQLGVAEDRIYHFYDLHNLIYRKEIKKPIRYFGATKEQLLRRKEKKILLLSQDMTLGGPAIALFHAAEILVKNGYEVVFGTMIDGPLRQKLLDIRIPVILDVNLQIETMKDAEWIQGFSLVFCNAINFCVFLSERDTSTRFVWWLHDSSFFYDGIKKKLLQDIDRKNLTVCSVGKIPGDVIKSYIPDLKTVDLIYGVKSMVHGISEGSRMQKTVCFVTIGFIERRKGQDLLVTAIRLLPEDVRKKAVFYLVGQNSSIMAENLKEIIAEIPEIKMTGAVDREQINEILNAADVMICPSREDPMPTVAAEAMMHSVPCLISDAAGTAAYIQAQVNGFIFHSEDVEELSEKIRWCIESREMLPEIGARARKIYEQYFSMEVFERDLLKIVTGS